MINNFINTEINVFNAIHNFATNCNISEFIRETCLELDPVLSLEHIAQLLIMPIGKY